MVLHHSVSRLLSGLVLSGLLITSPSLLPALCNSVPQAHAGRLSGLIKSTPNLYMPSRFLIGQEHTLLVKAPAGNRVVVFISPDHTGFTKAPAGLDLHIGEQTERLEGIASDKGVAKIRLVMPDNEAMEGHHVFLDGYTYSLADESDAQQLSWMDPTGRQTRVNSIQIAKMSDGTGARILPGLPGVGGEMLRRVSTMQDIRNGGDRLKDMVDDGARDDNFYDQNTFITRPDGTGGL